MSQGRFKNTLVEASGRLVIANRGKLGYKSRALPDGVLSFGVCINHGVCYITTSQRLNLIAPNTNLDTHRDTECEGESKCRLLPASVLEID